MTEQFKSDLKQVVKTESLDSGNWKSESWLKLIHNVSQDILNDAFNQHDKLCDIFDDTTYVMGDEIHIVPRKCKKISRIHKKTEEITEKGGEYFKVLSDFIAGRIHCEVREIPGMVDKIKSIVNDHNGTYYVKGSNEEHPYGWCKRDGKYTDITQYIYVYIEEIGYPIELQIGHEFASLTFTIDSALRDDKDCGMVDLWTDDFYGKVKSYLLMKANLKKDILTTVTKIHNGRIPPELGHLLNKMF